MIRKLSLSVNCYLLVYIKYIFFLFLLKITIAINTASTHKNITTIAINNLKTLKIYIYIY